MNAGRPLLFLLALAGGAWWAESLHSEPLTTLRVALSRNLMVSGLWDTVTKDFTTRRVEVVLAGEREDAASLLREGKADLICIHDSGNDLAKTLVKDGSATQARAWISSELVFIGPHADPAGIRGLNDGGEALRRIVASGSPLLDYHGTGSRETMQKLWERAGVCPEAGHLIKVERSTDKAALLRIAAEKGAYVVTGRSPTLAPLLAITPGAPEILVENDGQMRRIFYVLQTKAAQPLADYLLGTEVLKQVKGFTSERTEGQAVFAPVNQEQK